LIATLRATREAASKVGGIRGEKERLMEHLAEKEALLELQVQENAALKEALTAAVGSADAMRAESLKWKKEAFCATAAKEAAEDETKELIKRLSSVKMRARSVQYERDSVHAKLASTMVRRDILEERVAEHSTLHKNLLQEFRDKSGGGGGGGGGEREGERGEEKLRLETAPTPTCAAASCAAPPCNPSLSPTVSDISEFMSFSLPRLQQMIENGTTRKNNVDPAKIELMLSEEEFEETFYMSKKNFEVLPVWRQQTLKRDVGLF
jgi:hypothetical protein